MALCSYSSKLAMDGFTAIENTFFNEFLPQATGEDVKVYLFGLSLCCNPNADDNSLDTICKVLSLTETEVKRAFSYWQEMGLVQIVSKNPYEVRFLPVHAHSGSSKIRNTEKYSGFNDAIQGIITGRMITPNEFNEYYSLIEVYHLEEEALILIANYCVKLKSNSIGYPYILAVARNFIAEGLKTSESIEQKLLELENSSIEIKQVLSALGIKREADIDERNLFVKWTSSFGFTLGVIVQIAKNQKKRGGFSKLDETLTKYYEQKLFTIEEIALFSEKQEELFETAKKVCKTIGLNYQSYDNVVDTYITNWDNKGYDSETLAFIAQFCFTQSIRSLEGMNSVIQNFYKLGVVSLASLQQYIDSIIENDEKIKEILNVFKLLRLVSSNDRELYKTWTESWGFEHSQILKVASLLKEKTSSLPYMGKVLSSIHERGLTDDNKIEEYIKNSTSLNEKSQNKPSEKYKTRDLSKEQLNAVLDSLDDLEI